MIAYNRFIVPIACGFLLVSLPVNADAQVELQPHYGKVKLEIEATEGIKNLITSYITRELQSIPNVKIVEKDPWWLISIVAIELKPEGGRSYGFAFSVVVLRPFYTMGLKDFINSDYPDHAENINRIIELHIDDGNLNTFEDFQILSGSNDNLKSTCEKFVADFHAEFVEETRKSIQKTRDWLKQKNKRR